MLAAYLVRCSADVDTSHMLHAALDANGQSVYRLSGPFNARQTFLA